MKIEVEVWTNRSQIKQKVMIQSYSSERVLPNKDITSPNPNGQSQEETGSDTLSLKTETSQSARENSTSKGRMISRKPNSQKANFETFQHTRRKSQQKIEQSTLSNRMNQPPLPQKPSTAHSITSHSEKNSESQEIKMEAGIRFKKKAMSKQQTLEIKEYMRSFDNDKIETNSIAASQKAHHEGQVEPFLKDKKSKTQYFHFQECYGTQQFQMPENSSDNDKIQLTSLKEKCKSVDYTNGLLNKRLQWLRQEIEMHLERQQDFKDQLNLLQTELNSKSEELKQTKTKNQQLEKQLQYKNMEILKMREFIVDLNTHFDNDREILVSEIQYLKSERESDFEEQEKAYIQKIQELEMKIEKIKAQAHQAFDSQSKDQQAYYKGLVQRLANENKYLKMENHMLARYKEDISQLKKENKQIANQRDTLKKKIIQNAKKEAQRMRMFDDSESSSMNSLSELTYSLTRIGP